MATVVATWYGAISAFKDTGKGLIKTLSGTKVMIDKIKVRLSDKAKKDLEELDKNKH
jgi:hypothetical protein